MSLLRGAALVEQLRALPFARRDAWVDELLALEESPADGPELPAGGVPYLPSSVEEIVALVEEAPVGAGESARATVTRLGLDRVTFTHANAAEMALDGSRFFLYAPCNGALLAQVLDLIEWAERIAKGIEPI